MWRQKKEEVPVPGGRRPAMDLHVLEPEEERKDVEEKARKEVEGNEGTEAEKHSSQLSAPNTKAPPTGSYQDTDGAAAPESLVIVREPLNIKKKFVLKGSPLGAMYDDGKGVKQDKKKAADLYRQAHDAGDAYAAPRR